MSSKFKNILKSKMHANNLAAQLQIILEDAVAHHQRGQLNQAKAMYECVLKREPKHFDALHLLGVIAFQTGNWQLAVDEMSKSIAINPNHAPAHSNLGNALRGLQQYEAGVESFNRAIAIKPDFAEAYSNRGVALRELGQYEAALRSFDAALAIKPDYAEAHCNRGNVLRELKNYELALESYDQAVNSNPLYADAYLNRGIVLKEVNQYEAALKSFDRVIEINPECAEAFSNRGIALQELALTELAILSYDRAIAIKPDFAEAYINRGNALRELKQFEAAVVNYEQAISLKSGLDYLFSMLLFARISLCDWTNYVSDVSKLISEIGQKEKSAPPFTLLPVISSLSLQRKATGIWVKEHHSQDSSLGSIPKRTRSKKIRIGYYSADYHNHATTYLMSDLFERHDKNEFELIAFSFGPKNEDAMRYKVVAAFDQFIDVRLENDKNVAELSRILGIDIAIDLKGFTQDGRPGIFSYRAAPIQVSYLGYPGTMAADYIDYLIADQIVIPKVSQEHYSEKIVYLPNSYQVNDDKREISEKVFTRVELGLPEFGFVFCCFNNSYKITPRMFEAWIRILNSVEGSCMWLLEDNPAASNNLCKEATKRGLDPQRLVFAKRMSLADHLARHRLADLFLDTFPCNAHTTASDSLWAGLPVLTLAGEAFAGRVASSLLTAIDLPEMIAYSQENYESMAIEFARSPRKLHSVRERLEKYRLTAPLFDVGLFTRNLEAAYVQMHERYLADLAPDHIYV